jgi:tetratricopeptide (TPR) repeat protein
MPTAPIQDKPKPPSGRSGGPAYLYHQQQPAEKPRPARKSTLPRKPKPRPESNAGHRYFMGNLRTFLYVVAGMLVICVIGWLIAQQAYQSHLRENQRRIEGEQFEAVGARDRRLSRPDPVGTTGSAGEVEPDLAARQPIDLGDIRKALYLYDMGRARMKEQNYDAAVLRFQEALELNRFLYRAWADLGYVYLEMKDAAKAQVALEHAIEGDATNPEVLSNLGLAYLNQDQHDKARELFEQAMAVDPSYPKSHFYLAKSHIRQRDFDQAMISLERYLRMEPSDAPALRDRAFIEAQRKQYNQALDNLKRAIAERPDWADLYWDAAACCALLGRAEDSIRYLEKGEAFTNASEAYRAWQSPAFEQLRNSAPGKIYEKELADRVRRALQNPL